MPELQDWPATLDIEPSIFSNMSKKAPPHTHLQAWREKKGLSQEQVGDILGMDRSQVHRWEKGKRDLKLEDLQRLAEVYGVPVVALLLSPDDLQVAEMLTEAHKILTGSAPEAIAAWLAMGRAMLQTRGSNPS